MTNSTLSGNTAAIGGGGIFTTSVGANDPGALTVTNSTLAGNSAGTGGGIFNESGVMVVLMNTIVANSPRLNLYGMIRGNNNLIDDTSAITGSNNLANTPALLGTLGSYGGPTQAIPLLTGSPAIAHGDPAICAATGVGKVNGIDQRSFPRHAGVCSIGAFEAQPVVAPLPPTQPPGPAGGPPSPLPPVRPPGTTAGSAPNSLPTRRP